MTVLRMDYPGYHCFVHIGSDHFARASGGDMAVAYECGPFRLRFAVLRIPADAKYFPGDPDWNAGWFLQTGPAGQLSWESFAGSYQGRRLLVERPPKSEEWVWGSGRK